MNRMKRFLAQALIWIVFTILLWNFSDQSNGNLINQLLQLSLQLIIVATVIFLISKQLFVKRKIGLFIVITITIVLGFSWLMSLQNITHMPMPHGMHPRAMEMEHRPPLDHHNLDEFTPEEGRPLEHIPPLPRPPSPNLFWNMFLLFSTTYSLCVFWESTIFAMKKEEETIKNKSEHVKTELKLLKSQINPHFLFNSLNNIYALSVMDSDKTQQSISYLSDMLRYVLYECDQPLVPLKKEIAYVNNYIKLFSLKSSKPYSITTHFEIDDSQVLVAPMLFIPFIENALKHGNIEQRNQSFIRISVHSSINEITYRVSNSMALEQKIKDEAGGIGLDNVRKRLEILYPNQHELLVTSASNEFQIVLTLQIENHV